MGLEETEVLCRFPVQDTILILISLPPVFPLSSITTGLQEATSLLHFSVSVIPVSLCRSVSSPFAFPFAHRISSAVESLLSFLLSLLQLDIHSVMIPFSTSAIPSLFSYSSTLLASESNPAPFTVVFSHFCSPCTLSLSLLVD